MEMDERRDRYGGHLFLGSSHSVQDTARPDDGTAFCAIRLHEFHAGGPLHHLLLVPVSGGRGHHRSHVSSLYGDRARAPWRVLRSDSFFGRRHDVHGRGHGHSTDLHRPGTDGYLHLRPGRFFTQGQAFQRSCIEVPASGRVFFGNLRLRIVVVLWAHGQHELADHCQTSCRASGETQCNSSDSFAHDGNWSSFQDCCHSLPSVGARRLRRRSHQRYRLHVRRRKGRSMGHAAANFLVGTLSPPQRVGPAPGICLCDHDDWGESCCPHAEQPQAPAGIFIHRSRRIYAARPGRSRQR